MSATASDVEDSRKTFTDAQWNAAMEKLDALQHLIEEKAPKIRDHCVYLRNQLLSCHGVGVVVKHGVVIDELEEDGPPRRIRWSRPVRVRWRR